MASMRDIAREAGVCVATVSRILSADAGFKVSDQTRERVLSTAIRLCYPVKLADTRRGKIQLGCVLSLTAEKYGDPYFTAILSAAEEEAGRLGAAISFLCNYTDLQDPEFLKTFLNRDLDGLFLMENLPLSLLKKIKERFPNIVSIDDDSLLSEVNAVGYDPVTANLQVMVCLLSRGYRRIALISGPSSGRSLADSIRTVVYREALRRAEIPFDPELIKDCDWDMATCSQQTRALMKMPNPPDAIFAGSDSIASVVLSTLYADGYRCPKDVGVIGFNNIPFSAHLIPALTTVELPTTQMGQFAVQRLVEMVRGQSGAVRRVLFPTMLVERNSLKESAE